MIINPPTFCYGFLYPSFGHRLFLNQILDHQHLFFLDNTGKVGTENGISFRRGYRVLIFGHVFSWVIKSCSVFKVEGDKVFWREQASPVPLLSLLWNFTHPFRRRKNQLLGARHDETAVCVAVNQVLHYIWSIYYLIGETVFLFFFFVVSISVSDPQADCFQTWEYISIFTRSWDLNTCFKYIGVEKMFTSVQVVQTTHVDLVSQQVSLPFFFAESSCLIHSDCTFCF